MTFVMGSSTALGTVSWKRHQKREAIMKHDLKSTRVLLDNGIFSHSEFAEEATKEISIFWAGKSQVSTIWGIRGKSPKGNKALQEEIDFLPTVAQLIRENVIEAYNSKEIECERLRHRPLIREGNVLNGCEIRKCPPPIDRSKFVQTANFIDYFAKGGKKDLKAGVPLGQANQISFMKFLCSLTEEATRVLLWREHLLGLSTFEIESLRNLSWFQFLCQRSGSPEHYPDIFHLWTAERNGLDVLLTLDGDLPKLISRVQGEKRKTVAIKTKVLRPSQLLEDLGVKIRVPVPLEANRFYQLHELRQTTNQLRKLPLAHPPIHLL